MLRRRWIDWAKAKRNLQCSQCGADIKKGALYLTIFRRYKDLKTGTVSVRIVERCPRICEKCAKRGVKIQLTA
jgi:PHP family Zn ribbon phosphoesterase